VNITYAVTLTVITNYVYILFDSFFFQWGVANLLHQVSMVYMEHTLVSVVLSTTSFFTLLLSLFFVTPSTDRFTVAKLITVLFSITGNVCTHLNNNKNNNNSLFKIQNIMYRLYYLNFTFIKVNTC